MKKLSPIFALFLVLTTIGCGATKSEAIQASGQIEATQVAIAPEMSGRVVEVFVNEGEAVQAGDPLLRLDDSLLLSQVQAAQAAFESTKIGVQVAQSTLDTAQAQYEMALSTALAQVQPNRQETWDQPKADEFDQPSWYFSQEEQIISVQAEIESAMSALNAAQENLGEIEEKTGSATFLEIEKKLSDARVTFDVAMTVLDHTSNASDGIDLHNAAQNAFIAARTALRGAQREYDRALTKIGAKQVLRARAEVEVAREHYYASLDMLRTLQTGEYSLSVITAGKAVDQAKAMLEQAQSAVTASQANLNLILAQMDKLIVRASMDGIVLVRSIEAGEVIQAGMPAMTIGKLDILKLTVYIPETQYGLINLGQQASLSIDSFPDETFSAGVTWIADKAEFTPQNVQTKEGRQTTVYAIELTVDNVDGKLKPGMPVEVTFGLSDSGS